MANTATSSPNVLSRVRRGPAFDPPRKTAPLPSATAADLEPEATA